MPFAAATLAMCVTLLSATPVVSSVGQTAPTMASATVVGHNAETGDPQLRVEKGKASPDGGAAAWASYSATYQTIGWDVINVTTAAGGDVNDTMYAAGYLEGALSQTAIWHAYQNMYGQFFMLGKPPPKKFTDWMDEHMQWLAAQVKEGSATPGPEHAYWVAVGAVLAQLRGVSAGYTSAAPSGQAMSYTDMLVMNLDGDLETLMGAIGEMGRSAGSVMFEKLGVQAGAGYHCSALVRVSPKGDDVFFGHDTWDTYASMVRMYKHYNFHLGPNGAPTPVSMSSTPGWLSSVDDFYLTGADLCAIETTNGLNNHELLKKITPKGGLMSWVRVMVANYLATDGKSWSDTFSIQNGGTYNNQWFVVDMKKFVANQPLKPGLLWVLEQIPGYIHSEDQTAFLTKMGYWPSYNAPFYEDIANMSGMRGAWESAPRHFIFERNATMVHDLDSFGNLMRYNNYKHDPLSHGNPGDAIMARGDLVGSAGGGIDSKISSWQMSSGGKRAAMAMNGPTHSQLPPFSWSGFKGGAPPHVGQPDTFAFDYESMSPGKMSWP